MGLKGQPHVEMLRHDPSADSKTVKMKQATPKNSRQFHFAFENRAISGNCLTIMEPKIPIPNHLRKENTDQVITGEPGYEITFAET